MTLPTSTKFNVEPSVRGGGWYNDVSRHAESAKALLSELVDLCAEVVAKWPVSPDMPLPRTGYEEVYALSRKRDRTSDSVILYTAFTVEGFLNLYGVVRCGQAVFNEHFERMPITTKLRMLLLVCDSIDVAKRHPVVLACEDLARQRNKLAHPKAVEQSRVLTDAQKNSLGTPVPQSAQDAYQAMSNFFEQFRMLSPTSARLTPSL
jgi:hypothetical protein